MRVLLNEACDSDQFTQHENRAVSNRPLTASHNVGIVSIYSYIDILRSVQDQINAPFALNATYVKPYFIFLSCMYKNGS